MGVGDATVGRSEPGFARCRVCGSALTATALLMLALAIGGCAAGSTTSASTPGEPATPALGTSGAKNVIVMIADGSGYSQFEAASIYESGTRTSARYRSFPVRVAMSTYPSPEVGGAYDSTKAWASFDWVRQNPTDSAAAATALSTGVKTYQSAVGVDTQRRPLTHALERAEASGRSTGLVTTVPISHATPAGFGAHNSSRDNYRAIANELLGKSAVDVLMGAGNPYSTESGRPRFPSTEDFDYVGGRSTWRGLEAGQVGGDADGDGDADPFKLIETQDDFYALMSGATPERVCGVARVSSTMQQKRRGDTTKPAFAVSRLRNVPTLEVMAQGAINVLDEDPDGFFLMIEGGAGDWANHGNQKGRLIEEQVAFDDAVGSVIDWVESKSSWSETLLIVTADHESGYLTGPGSGQFTSGPVWKPIGMAGAGSMPGMQYNSTGHTNQLVPLFARGAGSELLSAAANRTDIVRGAYCDNTDVGKTLHAVLRP